MNTPIYDFLKSYEKSSTLRLHMPGHKGKGCEANSLDITEISGADSLFDCNGIILDSEKNASSLFNTARTLYSTQGSTLSIQTMLSLVRMKQGGSDRPLIIAVRNAHRAFLNACALLDCDVMWVYPKYTQGNICSGEYTDSDIENAILSADRTPSAVFVTSPDYLGRMADIKGIARVCKKHGVTFLVDNAHGAYLNFLSESLHPISLGADMTSDSAHKTLPVLTGGGYLHISKTADSFFVENAKAAMSLFASTSPSYLIMSSLDRCNKYLAEDFRSELDGIISAADEIKSLLSNDGWCVCESEPLKLTLFTSPFGLTGMQTAQLLREMGAECEYCDETHIVFMLSTGNTSGELYSLYKMLSSIKKKDKALELPPVIDLCAEGSGLSLREAVLSPSEGVCVDDSLGRICSKSVTACPPGIPVAVPGEVVSEEMIKIFKRYSILSVNVVK